jgi:hypothetical protein
MKQKWFEVVDYPSLEMSNMGKVRVKAYTFFKGNKKINCPKRLKSISRKGDFFVSETGWNMNVNIKDLQRGKQVS